MPTLIPWFSVALPYPGSGASGAGRYQRSSITSGTVSLSVGAFLLGDRPQAEQANGGCCFHHRRKHVSNRWRINQNSEEALNNDNQPESPSTTGRLDEPVNRQEPTARHPLGGAAESQAAA